MRLSIRHRVPAIAAAVLTATIAGVGSLVAAPQNARPSTSVCDITTTERVVAIGDVHGAYDTFTAILREAGLIDTRQRWTGGRAILVQTGDVVDRGADSRKIMDLLRRLETEAPRAGGRVIALLGNHEIMRMTGDLRYVSDGEYAAFRSPEAAELRESWYQVVLNNAKAAAKAAKEPFDEREYRERFLKDMPLGSFEMQRAFMPDGEYGRWLRGHDTMAMVNGVVFLHGGTSPGVATLGCSAVNDQIRSELKTARVTDPAYAAMLLGAADGPVWYRGLVEEPPAVDAESLDSILRALRAKAIVVGHTVTGSGKLRQTFEGRVTQIDTGMLAGKYFPDGAASALEIINGAFTAIYAGGKREPLSSPAAPAR